ncbi:MAG: hypothetical protein ACOYZ8_15925 [Chloroflexota bacterium]
MKKILALSFLLAFAFSACNFPTPTDNAPAFNDQAATIVAQTLTGAPLATPTAPGTPQTPLASPLAPGTPSPTATLTPTITPTYSTPFLRINESTNCRTGPGQEYEIVFTFLPGASTEIVAHYPADNYWVVKLPNSNNTCWVWGEYATPSGSYWAVPSTTPPPTATAVPPAAPRGLTYSYLCTYNGVNIDATTTLTWKDMANNETGYRVLRLGTGIVELPANSTTYTDTYAVNAGDTITYSIVAFNSSGSSQSGTISFSCQ